MKHERLDVQGLHTAALVLVLSILLTSCGDDGTAVDCQQASQEAADLLAGELHACHFVDCRTEARRRCRLNIERASGRCDTSACESDLANADAPPGAALECPADSPDGSEVVNDLLTDLTPYLNDVWPTAAVELGIDPLEPVYAGDIGLSCLYGGFVECLASKVFPDCEHEYIHVSIDSLTGLSDLVFEDLHAIEINGADVSSHSSSGPEAHKVVDGIFQPEGSNAAGTLYSLDYIQSPGSNNAIVIDLGSTVAGICAGGGTSPSRCGNTPVLQAYKYEFQLDYSLDGVHWLNVGKFPAVTSSGLRTRHLVSDQPVFDARYVRVYPTSTSANALQYDNYVTELQMFNLTGNVALGKPTFGSPPNKINDGQIPAEGTAWNDYRYAVYATDFGSAHALTIDLGEVVEVCGSSDCGLAPFLQASHYSYTLGYSSNGLDWSDWGTFSASPYAGLRSRRLTDPPASSPSTFFARYVRVFATPGQPATDGAISISELTLSSPAAAVISQNKKTLGAEPLYSNGEFAPEGYVFDDAARVTLMFPPPPNPSAPDPNHTETLFMDLGQSWPISQIKFQANAWSYEVLIGDSIDGPFTLLWQVPRSEDDPEILETSGVRTRISPLFPEDTTARYLNVRPKYTSGDDFEYGVSEIQVLSPSQTVNPCAYDERADACQDFSCSYDGAFSGTASISLPAALQAHFDYLRVHVTCTNGLFDQGYTLGPELEDFTCTARQPSGHVRVNFCAGSCAEGSPPSALTYFTIPDGGLAIGVADLTCDIDPGTITQEIYDAIVDELESTVIAALTGPITDAMNSVLKDVAPFPGTCDPYPSPPMCIP